MRQLSRWPLACALLLSIALHLLWFTEVTPTLPHWQTPPAEDIRPLHMKLVAQTPTTAPTSPKPSKAKAKTRVAPPTITPPETENTTESSQEAVAAIPPADPAPPAPIEPLSDARHFPAHSLVEYEVYYGRLMAGWGEFEWTQSGQQYQIDVRLRPLFGPRLSYQSRGSIDPQGLRPDEFRGERNGELREHALFDWAAQTLTINNATPVPLEEGAQDIISIAYHIALTGGVALNKPLQITTGKKVYHYPVRPVGDSDILVGKTKVATLLIMSQGEGDSTEFWLAPDYHNLPLRIRRKDGDMTLDQRALRVVIDDKVVLDTPKEAIKHEPH